MISSDSKLIIPILFHQQEQNRHHIPRATQTPRHHHIPRDAKAQEMVHGEISLHLEQVGLPIHGGIEIQLDQEIEFIQISTLIVIEVHHQFETEIAVHQTAHRVEQELHRDLEELQDDNDILSIRTSIQKLFASIYLPIKYYINCSRPRQTQTDRKMKSVLVQNFW